jgi:hypothetical protein
MQTPHMNAHHVAPFAVFRAIKNAGNDATLPEIVRRTNIPQREVAAILKAKGWRTAETEAEAESEADLLEAFA